MVFPRPTNRDALTEAMSQGSGVQDVNFFGRKGMKNLGINDALIKRAERLLIDKGGMASPEARKGVLEDTGLFAQRGIPAETPALQWKMEGPSFQARLKGDVADFDQGGFSGTISRPLQEMLDYPELFQAYPDLAQLDADAIVLDPLNAKNITGGYRFDLDPANPNMFRRRGDYTAPITAGGQTREQLLEALLHEVQHAIQFREGFPSGWSSLGKYGDTAAQQFADAQKRAVLGLDRLNLLRPTNPTQELEWITRPEISRLLNQYNTVITPPPTWSPEYFGYRLSAGELEADNAANRAREVGSQDAQIANPPWSTQMFPEELAWRRRWTGVP